MKVLHFCAVTCWRCHGSGEGMADGSTCFVCRGKGLVGPGEIEVEVDEMESPQWCESCGQDLRIEVWNAEKEE